MQQPALAISSSHLLTSSLREAINALYSQNHRLQRPADVWLQDFRSSPGSWRVCLHLLDAPQLQEHECYFAANNIKAACQRHQDMLEPVQLHELLVKLALHMQACILKHQWSSSQQLAGAAAALAVRASALQPSTMLQDLQTLFISSTAAASAAVITVPSSPEQLLMAAAGAGPFSSQRTAAVAPPPPGLGNQSLGLHVQQDAVALAAILQLLAALPDAALSKQTSLHPDRRTAVSNGLKQTVWAAQLLNTALCSQNAKLQVLACQAIVSWCELGTPPRGLEVQTGALEVLAAALLGRDTAVQACDAVAAMLTAIKDSSSDSDVSTGSNMQLLQQLVQQLQGSVLPAVAAEHRSMGHAAAAGSAGAALAGQSAADSAPYSAVLRSHLGPEAETAFCKVVSAAAAALLKPVLQGAVPYQPLLEVLLQQLLLSVCVSDDGVAMMSVDFWQDCYLATLQALPPAQQSTILLQQRAVLEALAGALVRRTQLSPAAAAAATADARDLPEDMRMVRRELASALRDIGALLGPQTMLSYITQLVSSHYQHLCSTQQAAANPNNSRTLPPSAAALHGGNAGLAAGPVVYRTTGGGWANNTIQIIVPADSAVGGAAAVGGAGSGNALAGGSGNKAGDWLPLESALYAANVLLGRQAGLTGDAADQQLQQLVQYAAAAVTHAGGSMKLAGTALTLLGGLAAWLPKHPAVVPAVLAASAAALQSPSDKLSRNAATCIQRLSGCDDLALLITRSHPQFVQQLLQEYQQRGGRPGQSSAGSSDDKPTEELLLLSLCSLAVAHTSNSSDMDSILLQLVGPQVGAATAELAAALHGNWPSIQQQQQQPAVQGGYRHLKQQQKQQQQQQAPVLHSTAISCFKALSSLVMGLPTGTSKQSLGVPMHSRHPRHQQQLQQQQQQQQKTVEEGHKQLATGMVSSSSADDAIMHSVDAHGSSTVPSVPAAAVAVQCQGRCSHPHCTTTSLTQRQHQPADQAAAGAAAEQRQHQACFIVSQLLVRTSQAVLMAIQTAVKAAGEQRVHCHMYAQQLLSAACTFLLAAFPAAVHYQVISSRPPAAAAPMIEQTQGSFTIGHSHQQHAAQNELGADVRFDALSTKGSSTNLLQAGVLLQQLCQLLQHLPVHLLQQPCCLQLLSSSVAAGAAAEALPAGECSTSAPAGLDAAAASGIANQQQLLEMLQGLTRQALGAAAANILQQQGGADPDHTSAALVLAAVSLQQCPAVLATADLDLLLSLTLTAAKTYHLKQCTTVLDWMQVLAQASCCQQQQPQHITGADAGAGSRTCSALQQRLESGMGAQLVLSILLAASGAMPPDVVLPISFCLHSVWLSVGQRVFVSWLTAAVIQLAPESAPWMKQRHVAKVAFVSELTDAACLTDTTRFKRVLKNFCGGKKKGR